MDITVKILMIGIVVYSGGQFKEDINTENPLGTGGKLAIIFANLMSNLWSGKDRSLSPYKLKVTKKKKNRYVYITGYIFAILANQFHYCCFYSCWWCFSAQTDGCFVIFSFLVNLSKWLTVSCPLDCWKLKEWSAKTIILFFLDQHWQAPPEFCSLFLN